MEIITPELKFIADDIKAKSTPPPMVSQIPSILNQKSSFVSMVIKDERSKRSLSGYSNVKHSDIFAEKGDGTYIAKYDSYDNSGGNQEEYFAQKQTTGEKWTNGTLKLLGKTGTAALGGTVGVVDGLIEGIYKGSLSEGYNSGVNKWLDGLNTTMEYTLPNRYTEQDREASLLGQMGQANFWADKAFGGLSFTLGALVSEGIWGAATGGASLLSSGNRLARLANWTAKGLGGEARLVRAMNVAKTTAKGSVDNMLEGIVANEGNVLRTINDATKSSASNYYQFKKLGEIGLVATRSAGFESGMEARQYMNSTEHAWLEKYQEANGKEPSLEEYSTFKDGLTNSANAVFGANMAIVGGSNIAQFGSALLGRTTNPAIGNSLIKRNLFGIGFDKTVSDAGKITYKALEASGRQKVAGRVWGVLGSAVTESQEEMSQRVVSLTAENFMLGGIDPKHIKSTYDMAEAFTDAMHNTYGTKDGWSEGLVGAVVGVFGAGAHSRFKFGSVTAERENVKDVTTYANSFTAENHFNNLIANNKIMQAQEYKESAVSKKDIVGEQLADTMSSIAFIERNQAIGNTKEAVNDLALQMKAISDEDLAEELGFGKGEEARQQAAEFKKHKIAEFKNLAQTHEKNLNYAEALFGETEIAGFDKFSTREAIRAVATTITLGDKSLKINQDLVNHVKALVADSVNLDGVTDAMSVQQILDLAPREKTLKLSQLNAQYFVLDRQEKELRSKEFEASKLTDTEDNKTRTNTLTDLAKQLQDLQNKKEEIREQKQLALDVIGVKTYSDVDVTVEMFDAQNENLEKLKETLANIKKTNPERYSEISKALIAQSKAVAHIKGYQKTIEMIGDPKSRIKILNGWLTKFTNKTKLSDSMEAYITSVITDNTEQIKDTFQTGVDVTERANFRKTGEVSEEYKQQVGKARRRGETLSETDKKIYEKFKTEIEENAKETIEEKAEETASQEVSNLQKLKDKVKAIISSNEYLTQYFGQDLAEQKKSKPSETDIKKYEELLSKIDRRVESNISKIVTSPEKYYDSAIGLSNEEIDELVEVQTKLNDWLTLEGALDKDNQSVAQMLDLISSLEAVKSNENVIVTPTYESVLSSKSEEEEGLNTNFVRGLQTPTEALATVHKGVLRISHLRTKTLETFFPGSNLVDNTNGSFTLLLPSGKSLNIEENEEGGQDIDLDDWNAVEAESNVLIKNFGTKSQAISQALPSNTDVGQFNGMPTNQINHLLNTPSSQIIEELDKLKTFQEKLNWLKEQNLLEPIIINGVPHDLVDYNGRNVVLMKIGGINIPFYISTGQAGKKTVKVGNWYAVFGIGTKAGWINKGTEEQINTQYGYPVLQKIAKILNEGVGNIENRENNGNGRLKDGIGLLEDDVQTLNSFNSQMNLTTQPAGSNTDIAGFNKHVSATLTSINEESLLATQNKTAHPSSELFQNIPSDFGYEQTDGSNMQIDKDVVNAVKNGEILELFVSTLDVFNSKLEKSEKAKQLHIYVMKGGKLLGSLPASSKKNAVEGVGLELVDLRKEAYDFIKANKSEETLIKLPQQIKAQISFIGAPNLTLTRNADGVIETKTEDFTKESLQHVVGQGFILDGVAQSETKIDVNQFTRAISKGNPGVKIPFVVFNYNGKNISFPIKLKTSTSNKSVDALNGENTAEKAKNLIDALIQNNLKAYADKIDFSDADWIDTLAVEDALKALEQVVETVSIDKLASKNYAKEELIKDAEIAIALDNKPFNTNKVMLTTTSEIAPDVLGYRELRETRRRETREAVFNVVEKARQIQQETNKKSRDFEASNSSEIVKILSTVYDKASAILKGINSVPKSVRVDVLEGQINTVEDLRKILNHPNKGRVDVRELSGKVKAFDNYTPVREMSPKLYEVLEVRTSDSSEALKHYTSRLSFKSVEAVGRDFLNGVSELLQQVEESDKSLKSLSGKLLSEEKKFNKTLIKRSDTLLGQLREKVKNVSDVENAKAESVKAIILEDALQEALKVQIEYKSKLLQDFPKSGEVLKEEGNYENVNLLKRLITQIKSRKDVTVDATVAPLLKRLTYLEGTSAKFIESGVLVDVLDEVDFVPTKSDSQNRAQLDNVRKLLKTSKADKTKVGIHLFNELSQELGRLDSLQSTVKNISEQIKNSPYYKDVDPALLVVDENGEIENPAITQEAIIEELGGIKDFEEFEEKAQEIETLNKNGQFLLDLFEETKEMDKVEVRVITPNGLENKPNTEVRDALVATMRDNGSNLLLNTVTTIASYSPEVLSSNSKEAQVLLKEIEKKALDNNIDLEGISDIGALLPYLQKVLNPSATEEDFNNFVEACLKAKSVVETPLQGVVRVADRFKGLKMVILEADEYSEYRLFKDYGLLHIDGNIYLVTDGHEAELAEVERKIEGQKQQPLLLLAKNEVKTSSVETQQSVLVNNGMQLSSPNIATLDATQEIESNNEKVISQVVEDNVSESEILTVAEELGVSVDEAMEVFKKEVEREVYKTGESAYNFSDKVKNIIKNIVKFLTAGALLFTVYYSTGNARDSATRKVNDYFAEEMLPKDTISFNETTFSVTSFNGCNAYVSNQLKHTIGALKFDKLGYYGDAWTATANTVRAGKGNFIYNIFKGYEKMQGINADTITSEINTLVTKSKASLKISSFKEGDVVNLFYEGSNFTKEAYDKGKDVLTSHVGIIKKDSLGNLVLEHNIHGLIKKDDLNQLVQGKLTSVKGKMLVSAIMRPSYDKIGATVRAKKEIQPVDVITDDAEYDADTVKKFIHYKNHFETPSRKVKNVDSQLKKIGKGVIKPKKSVITNYRNKQMKKEDKVLQNLVFNGKGITLKHTDKQSVDEMNEYLKKEVELRNYFLLSRHTNFDVATDDEAMVNMRDALYNGYRLEPFKGDHFRENDETRQVITESNFVTIGMDNFERVAGNIFAKIGKNESEFLEVDVEQPKLNVNPENLTSRSTVAEIKTTNNYTGEEGFVIDKENSCES